MAVRSNHQRHDAGRVEKDQRGVREREDVEQGREGEEARRRRSDERNRRPLRIAPRDHLSRAENYRQSHEQEGDNAQQAHLECPMENLGVEYPVGFVVVAPPTTTEDQMGPKVWTDGIVIGGAIADRRHVEPVGSHELVHGRPQRPRRHNRDQHPGNMPIGASFSNSRRRKYASVSTTAIGASTALLRYVANVAATSAQTARP
jgi:hypothetical protein